MVPAAVLTPEAIDSGPTATVKPLQPSHTPASPWPRTTEFLKTDVGGDIPLKPTFKKVSRLDEIKSPEPKQKPSQNDGPASVLESHAPTHPPKSSDVLKSPGVPHPVTIDVNVNQPQSGTLNSDLHVPLLSGGIDGKPTGGMEVEIVSTKPNGEIVTVGTRLPTSILGVPVAETSHTASQGKDGILIAENPISPDGQAITVSGEVISIGVNGPIFGTKTAHIHATARQSDNVEFASNRPSKSDDAFATGQTPSPGAQADPATREPFPTPPNSLPLGKSHLAPADAFPNDASGTASHSRPHNPNSPPTTPTPVVMITIGNQPITANPALVLIGPSATLLPGSPAIVVAGTPVSLNSYSELVIGGSRTVALVATDRAGATDGAAGGLGGWILKGLGGASASESASSRNLNTNANASTAGAAATTPEEFTGAAGKIAVERWAVGILLVSVVGMVLVIGRF